MNFVVNQSESTPAHDAPRQTDVVLDNVHEIVRIEVVHDKVLEAGC